MNKALLIGNLTKDPVLTTTSSGLSCCRFTIAINNFSNKSADFIPVVVWEKVAENCMKYLKKGSKVAIEGSVRSNSYDTQNGERRFSIDVTASRVEFLSTNGPADGTQANGSSQPEEFSEVKPIDENLEF